MHLWFNWSKEVTDTVDLEAWMSKCNFRVHVTYQWVWNRNLGHSRQAWPRVFAEEISALSFLLFVEMNGRKCEMSKSAIRTALVTCKGHTWLNRLKIYSLTLTISVPFMSSKNQRVARQFDSVVMRFWLSNII